MSDLTKEDILEMIKILRNTSIETTGEAIGRMIINPKTGEVLELPNPKRHDRLLK